MKDNMYTATEVSKELNISVKTLNNWYLWYNDKTLSKPNDTPNLPDYIQEHERGPRYWTKDSITKLRYFQDWLPRGRNGVMGRFSERYWGKRSKA